MDTFRYRKDRSPSPRNDGYRYEKLKEILPKKYEVACQHSKIRLSRSGKKTPSKRYHDDDDDFVSRHSTNRLPVRCHHHCHHKGRSRELTDAKRIASDSSDSDLRHDIRPKRSYRHQTMKELYRSLKIMRSISYDSDLPKRKSLSTANRKRNGGRDSDIEFLCEKKPKRFQSKEFSDIIQYYYKKSGEKIEEGRLKRALEDIGVALNLRNNCEEKDFVSKIISRRGCIHSLLERPRCSFQAFLDWEQAYQLNENNIEARKNMSKLLFMGANSCYRMKRYSKGLILSNMAVKFDSFNCKAAKLAKYLKKKILNEENWSTKVAPPSSVASTSNMETNTIESSQENSNEVLQLSKLTEESVEQNNVLRALLHIKKAIILYDKSKERDETVLSKLCVLKQTIVDMAPRCVVSDCITNV